MKFIEVQKESIFGRIGYRIGHVQEAIFRFDHSEAIAMQATYDGNEYANLKSFYTTLGKAVKSIEDQCMHRIHVVKRKGKVYLIKEDKES